MSKIKQRTISEHIGTHYLTYALHALQERGIPDFYDSLTNVQRFVIKNTPVEPISTLGVYGRSKSDGYVHGDASLVGAITKLAKEYGNANNILIGHGFFGNPINQQEASPRYTEVGLSKEFHEILKKYEPLNNKVSKEKWDYFRVEYPIGLVSYVTGIGVGYASNILPRRLEDIKDYMGGKLDSVPPYFVNFTGTIQKIEDTNSSWYILPDIEKTIRGKNYQIRIKDISPTIKYETFIKNINEKILSTYSPRIKNETNSKIDIILEFDISKVGMEVADAAYEKILKISTVKETETIRFIKDKDIVTYERIEDYLDDFKNYTRYLKKDKLEYDIVVDDREIMYLESKVKYLTFMLGEKRTTKEIENFFEAEENWISERLDNIKLRFLSKEYLTSTQTELDKLKKDVAAKKERLEAEEKKLAVNKYKSLAKVSVVRKV